MSPRLRSCLLAALLVASGARAFAVPVAEIACGETHVRFLGSQPEELVFYAQAGEVVAASVVPTPPAPGFAPRWRIADVEGRPVPLSNGDNRCAGRCETGPLPGGGAFTLRVADSGIGTGTYTVSFDALSATANGESNGPPTPACSRLVDGVLDGTVPVLDPEPIPGTILPVGEIDTFTLDVAAGAALRVELEPLAGGDGFAPTWSAFDADGRAVARVGDEETAPLATSGVVTVLVADGASATTGTYTVRVTVVSPPSTTSTTTATSTTAAASTTSLGGGSTTSTTTGVPATTTLPPAAALDAMIQGPAVGPRPRLGAALVATPERLVVGVPHGAARHGEIRNAGTALVIDVSGAADQPDFGAVVARLEDPLPTPGGGFGAALAEGPSGLLVGAPGARAAVHFDDPTDAAPLRLVSPDVAGDDGFGAAVAIAGDLLVVGAPRGAGGAGVVHVFDAATGTVQRTLGVPSGVSAVGFGAALATSGNVVLVGAPGDGQHHGAAFLFDAVTGALEQAFVAGTPAAGDAFGAALALDAGGAVIGAPGADAARGRVARFDVATGGETLAFEPSDPVAGERFGAAVAIGDGLVLAGAPDDVVAGIAGGAAFAFDATTGALDRGLHETVPGADDDFGAALAAAGGRVFVGAPGADTGTAGGGVVYVYEGAALVAAFRERLSTDRFGAAVGGSGGPRFVGAPDGWPDGRGWVARVDPGASEAGPVIAPPTGGPRRFGSAVASVGSTVAVGAPQSADGTDVGVVYLYDGPVLQTTIAHPVPSVGDEFGFAVARLGGDVLASAPFAGDGDTGRVYRLAPNGTLRVTYAKPAPTTGDFFGAAVAGDAGQVLVGAPLDAGGGAPAGAAYLFDGETAAIVRMLPNPGGTPDLFGAAVAIGPWIAVGAPLADDADLGGAVWVFERATGSIVRRLDNPRPHPGDGFGTSVAVFDGLLAVGAPFADEAGAGGDVGRVYLFDAGTGALRQTLRDPRQGAFDQFGFAVAGGDDGLFVGSPGSSAVYRLEPIEIEPALVGRRASRVPLAAALAGDAVCGNGLVEGAEACDDGNDVDADDCRNDCSGALCCAVDAVTDAVARCDDENPCTRDFLNAAGGCAYEPSGAPGCCTTDAECPGGQCRLCLGCFIYAWDCCETGSRCVASNPECEGETCIEAAYCQCGGKLDCGAEPIPDELRTIFDGACDTLRLQLSVVPDGTVTKEELALARQRAKSARGGLRRTIRRARALVRDGAITRACRQQVVAQARVVKRAVPRGRKLRRCVLAGG